MKVIVADDFASVRSGVTAWFQNNLGVSPRDITEVEDSLQLLNLVRSKHDCDALARCRSPLAAIAGENFLFWRDEFHVPDPWQFFWNVLPFSDLRDTVSQLSALVPARRVIGDAHMRYSEVLPEKELREKLQYLQHSDRASYGKEQCATYSWVRPLGLFIAAEGKNRVSLFQRSGVEFIPAFVDVYDYPSPDSIIIYSLATQAGTQCWAIRDHQFAERMLSPGWGLPLLRAYGVQVLLRWPDDYPAVEELERAYVEHKTAAPGERVILDLEIIRERVRWENGTVFVPLWSRLALKPKLIVSFAVLTAWFFGSVICSIDSDAKWTQIVGFALLAGAAATIATLTLLRTGISRRDYEAHSLSYNGWRRKLRATAPVKDR